eukprot:CAMPEP_0195130686 /NCGR_PEP_ID=MMETSP0448-20130528/143659_1 /TAXON_ID=66468 /ORGANISM="Heterocapsa triquestra, Strain CCMP 448" /LENGTH=151 /DNA_ID=CAMNT_0040168603 /DNA_START=1 /DNA_END=452 /DNA_ORIENTATION=+
MTWPIIELLVVVILIATLLVIMFLTVISMQLTNQRMAEEGRQRTQNLAKRTVVRALGITDEVQVEESMRDAIINSVQSMVPVLPIYPSYDGFAVPGPVIPVRTSIQAAEEMAEEEEKKIATIMSAIEALDVRIRQRARNAVPYGGDGASVA